MPLAAIERRHGVARGKLVVVTAITPTPAGEGKTTTAIALADALARSGHRAVVCLREPSVGPVFGIKGGGAGGGRSQLAPMEDVNLHFTGDIHAVGAANNLLAAMVDAHVHHGNALGIDPGDDHVAPLPGRQRPRAPLDRRRAGRQGNGAPRETGLRHHRGLRGDGDPRRRARPRRPAPRRLGRITVARTLDGEPVTAEDLGAAGAMTVLLKDALKPNLIQTLEGIPALVHCGPFANIAHGNNSLVADLLALRTADYVVTEGGFGSDMGFEKHVDIVCRVGGIAPSAVVLVATVRALRHHGDGDLARGRGESRAAHRDRAGLRLRPVVAVNRFPDDTDADIELVRGSRSSTARSPPRRPRRSARRRRRRCARRGGRGSVRAARSSGSPTSSTTPIGKIEKVARRVYGAAAVESLPPPQRTIERSGGRARPPAGLPREDARSRSRTIRRC